MPLCDHGRPWFRFSTQTSSVAGLALCLVAFTRVTLVVLFRGENGTAVLSLSFELELELAQSFRTLPLKKQERIRFLSGARCLNFPFCAWFLKRGLPLRNIQSNKSGLVGLHDFTSCQNAARCNKVFFLCWVDYSLEGSTFWGPFFFFISLGGGGGGMPKNGFKGEGGR